MRTEELAGFPLLEGLTAVQLATLAPHFRRESFAAGGPVFMQGDEARDIYILESGKVVIRFDPYDGGSLDIETIQPGDVFGWSAALARPRYTSSAVCLSPVRVMVIRGSVLRRLMRTDAALGALLLERMAQIVAHRLVSFRTHLINILYAEAEAESLSAAPSHERRQAIK